MNRLQIDNFIKSDRVREFRSASWFQGAGTDANMNPASLFETADLRVLFCSLASGRSRSRSQTYTAIDTEVHAVDNIYIDYAYYPPKEDLKAYERHQLPYWFGNLSHAPITDYDLVLVTTSISLDFVNIYHAYKSCGIPDTHVERMKRPDIPIILAGGIPCFELDVWGGDTGIVDLSFIGYAEGELRKLISLLAKRKKLFGLSDKGAIIKEMVISCPYLYYPNGYDVEYYKEKGRRHDIKSIKPNRDWVPEKVLINNPWNIDDFPGHSNKIFTPDGTSSEFAYLLISMGCTGGGQCSFCSEGFNCGPWREKSLKNLIADMDATVKSCAPNIVSMYSFNSGYYSRFRDLLHGMVSRFSRTILFNTRADIIADTEDYLEAVEFFGLKVVAMPIEGMGDRIRNKVLNKTLSYDQIQRAVRKAFKINARSVKIGMILTGLETPGDVDDFSEELEGIIKIKEEMGVSTSIKINFTGLVCFPSTPLGYAPRNSAIMSYNVGSSLVDFVRRFKDRVRFGFSSSKFYTFVDQVALDLGRLGTPIWRSLAESGFHFYGRWNRDNINFIEREIKALGIELEDIMVAKPRDHIFPVDFIHKKNESYIDFIYDSVGKRNFPPCVKTPVPRKSVCYNCGSCDTQDQKDSITNRVIKSEKTISDFHEAKFNNQPRHTYRISYSVNEDYYLYSKDSMAFKIAAKLCSIGDIYTQYHSVPFTSVSTLLRGNVEDWFHGNFYFDVAMNNPVPDIESAVQSVKMESCVINGVIKVEGGRRYPNSALTLLTADIKDISISSLRESIKSWDKNLKMGVRGRTHLYEPKFEMVRIEEVPEMYVRPIEGGIKLSVALPAYVNGAYFLSSLFRKGYFTIMALSKWRVIGHYDEWSGVCSCGSAKLTDLATLSDSPFCISCLLKLNLKS